MNGTLEVTAASMTITVAGYTGTYDGAAHAATYEASQDGVTVVWSTDGGSTWSSTVPSVTDVGEAVSVLAKATKANYADAVSETAATLQLAAKAITVTADSDTKVYDGNALTKSTATAADLVTGHTLSSVTVTGSQTDVGSSANVPSAATIVDGDNNDVTANYAINYVNGTLEVTAASMTITVAGYNGVYDGAAHAASAETVPADATVTWSVDGGEFTATVPSVTGVTNVTIVAKATMANYTVATATTSLVVTAATVEIPAAPADKTYNGAAQTADVASTATYTVAANAGGTNVGGYTVEFELADAANYTWSDGSTTNQTFGWSITPAAATVKANDASKKHGEADPASFSATVTGLQGSDTEAVLTYSVSREAGEAIGTYTITPAGDAAQGNYTVTYQTGSFTIESNEITIIWVVDGNETTNKVEWGDMPAFAGSTNKTDSTGKYAYAFTGWTPEVTNATVQAIYTAGFSQSIATPLELPLADHAVDSTVNGTSATVALAPAGLLDGTEVVTAPAGATYANGTLSFSGLDWNTGIVWSASAEQGEDPLDEAAYNEGAFYAKPRADWFSVTTNDFVAAADTSDAAFGITTNASPEGEMVRVHTKLEVPAGGLPQAPETGAAKVGFAVLQLEGDSAPAYYAYGNGTWTKLAGVAPAAGTVDYLAVYDLAADAPTARYYIDGVALYAESAGAKTYALPLASTTKSLSSISFASKEMVKDDVVAEYDISYVAAVDQAAYTNIVDALTAAGTAGEKMLALLKAGVPLDPAVSLGSGEKLVVNYAKGTFTNDTPVVSGVAGYDVKVTEAETVKTYELDAIVYPIEYVLDGGENAAANTNEYTVETLPVALADASRTGYSFTGWTNNVAAGVQTSIPVGTTGAVTNWATWSINSYALTVNYLYTNGTVAATAFTSNVVYDTAYSVDSPAITGYTPDVATVSGTMGAAALTTNVIYRANTHTITYQITGDYFANEAFEVVENVAYGTELSLIATDMAQAGYTFSGWSGLPETMPDEDVVVTGSYMLNAAAVISVADAETGACTTNYYPSLAAALADADNGETVQLLVDVEEPAATIGDANTAITLDLNGNTWTVSGTGEPPVTNAVTVAGDVLIVDNIQAGTGALAGDLAVTADGELTVAGGTVAGDVATTGGDVTVSGGTVAGGITAEGDSTVAVSGGSVTGGVTATDDADVTVSDTGSVAGGITSADGDVTVSGTGSVTGNVSSTGGEVAVTGGTVTGDIAATGGTVAVTGGSVTGGVAVSDGADVSVSGGSVAGGVTAEDDGSTISVTGGTVGSVAVSAGADATIDGTGTVTGDVSATGEGSTVVVSDGTVGGTLSEAEGGDVSAEGGHFAEDPSEFVADGYVAVPGDPDGYDVQLGKSVIGTTITVAGGTYNGSAYEISSIVLGDYTLTADDYTVVYTNLIDGVATEDNVNAGTVTATVTGKGEWIDSTNVTFTITKATLTITADNITVPLHTPADAVPYTFSYSGFVNGETNTVLSAQPTATTENPVYTASTAKGTTCTIVPSGAAAANYYISYVNGTLTVGDAEAPTMLETTAITVAGTDVTLLHKIQDDAAYHTFFTCTDLKTGTWVAAENSRATADIETVQVTDETGTYTAGTVTFHNVTDNVRFYQIGYSSLPYTAGEAMGEKPADAGDEEP